METRNRRSQADRSEATKRLILEAAIRLIARKGYAELRVADVAHEAGVSIGAQLHHFPNKDVLVVAVIDYCFSQAEQISRRRAASDLGAEEVLRRAIDDAKDFFYGEHFLIAINIVLSTLPPSDMRENVLKISRDARRPVEKAWRDAMIEAGFPNDFAGEVLTLSFCMIRGFAIRRLWDADEAWEERCLAIWREMIGLLLERHRASRTGPTISDGARP